MPSLTSRSRRRAGRRNPRGVPVSGTYRTFDLDGRKYEEWLHPTKGWRRRRIL